jgi:hypothetical protein
VKAPIGPSYVIKDDYPSGREQRQRRFEILHVGIARMSSVVKEKVDASA